LTELGLIDEAKQAVDKWMARWIEVVSLLHLSLYMTDDNANFP